MSAESFRQQHCSPEIRSAIAHLDARVSNPRESHAAASIQTALGLIATEAIATFADFEQCLREMDSRIHVLAMPLDYALDPSRVICPWAPDDRPAYVAYIEDSAAAAQKILQQWGITPEENLLRLESAGYTI